MRRGFGAAGIAQRKNDDVKLGEIGQVMRDEREEKIKAALEALKIKLRKFSAKFRDQIISDPELCQQFLSVCSGIGLDPLVSDRSVWDDIFGGGRFLPEVSVQVLNVCTESRIENGGVMELEECVNRINKRRGGGRYANVGKSDVERCVKQLECLGEGGLSIKVVNKIPFIFYSTEDIGPDALHLIGELGRCASLSHSEIRKTYNWARARSEQALTSLIRDGIVWVDYPSQQALADDTRIFLAP